MKIRIRGCGDIKRQMEDQLIKNSIYLLVTIAIYCSATGDKLPNIEYIRDYLIITGRDAMDGEFPYQISLQDLSPCKQTPGHRCGGSIIDQFHVLTAAHCVDGEYLPLLLIAAGTRNLTNYLEPNRVNLTIEEVYVHENYEEKRSLNDIAIVRVSPGFPLNSSFIRPIAMRTEEVRNPVMCTVTGWGAIQYPNRINPEILQALDVPLLKKEVCDQIPKTDHFTYDLGMLCAGYISGGCDVCRGDSGGPLVCDGQLTGLVSWGNPCAKPKFPAVYSDVAYYRRWIESTLALSYKETELGSS